MELKFEITGSRKTGRTCSNRTFMELKSASEISSEESSWFLSYLYGIEMSYCSGVLARGSSNRTFMELKFIYARL